MGSLDKEREEKQQKGRNLSFVTYLWMALASVTGGVLLGWWEYRYHPSNEQLWMVPFGLVLLVTPIFVLCSVFLSDILTPKDQNDTSEASQAPLNKLENSVLNKQQYES